MVGLIFHWGPYSIPAYCPLLKPGNGAEWYLKRLSVKEGAYRPIGGWRQTQAYHRGHYGDQDYNLFRTQFTPTEWQPDTWMKLAQQVGATYVILTARHHDGYCLWPSKVAGENCSAIDLVQQFKESALRHGLGFGLYYSWCEFGRSITKAYLSEVIVPQLAELATYAPTYWWFDGHWELKTLIAKKTIRELVSPLRAPGVEINDRVGTGDEEALSTYRVFTDRFLPTARLEVRWQHIGTIGFSWGRNRLQRPEHYQTGEQLWALEQKVTTLGGELLLNLGPNADGTLDEEEVRALCAYAELRQ